MATKTQIGAVIGIEGASEYKRELTNIVRVTKELESEIKLVESSFSKQGRTLEQNRLLQDKLKNAIAELTTKAEKQKEAQNAMNLALERAEKRAEDLRAKINLLSVSGEEYKKELQDTQKEYDRNASHINVLRQNIVEMSTAINETNTEINEHKNKLTDLPSTYQMITDAVKNTKSELGEFLQTVGKGFTKTFTVPFVAGATASIKAAVDWESALNGVRKTTNMTADELAKLEKGLKAQALTTTSTSTELANVAQIAGQLGVRGVDNILKFVQVVSDLDIATDLSAEDAATNLARILNITEHGDLDSLEELGSVIVHLGNNLATTEPEITAMANRMASAASIVGFTTPEIFALSGALTSVGITAEAGGSTVGQVLTNIDKQFAQFTQDGTGNLTRIAEISGMSADKFAQTWKNEPVKAFEAFINGLSQLDDESENINIVLDELDMAGIRQSNMLKALSEAQQTGVDTTGLFTKALELAEEAYNGVNKSGEEFNALQQEANVRKSESTTQFSNLAESVRQLGQAVGDVLLPVVIPLIQKLTDIFTWLASVDEPTKQFLLTIAGILAAIGPVLTIAGQFISLGASLATIAGVLGTTVGGLLAAIAPFVAIAVGIVAGIVAIIQVIRNWDTIVETVKAHFELFVILLQTLVGQIWEGIKTFFGNIGEDLLKLVEFIVAQFLLFFGSTLPNFVNNVVNGFKNMGSRVWETVKNIVNNIKETFSNMVSLAWNWGKDLIGNIISGIKNKISSLVDSVKNVASTIWSYLHFSEPEKGALSDFHTWMPDMMKGLAQGIDDNAYLVDNAISRVAESLTSPNQINYGGVVINLNVPQGTNGQQLVNEIEDELANRTIRRRAVFG